MLLKELHEANRRSCGTPPCPPSIATSVTRRRSYGPGSCSRGSTLDSPPCERAPVYWATDCATSKEHLRALTVAAGHRVGLATAENLQIVTVPLS